MATIHPPDMRFERGRRGEELVYRLLSQALPEKAFSVFYNVRFTIDPQGVRSREIDFVVLHPDRGCLFLEVKGGGYTHDPELGWCRVYQGRKEPDNGHGGPYGQIRTAAAAFMGAASYALGWDSRRPPIRWGIGVIFPMCSLVRLDGALPADARGDLTAEEDVCTSPERLRSWILARLKALEIARPVEEEHSHEASVALAKRYLVPRVDHLSKLAAQIARSDQLHDLLTAEQRTVVKLVGSRPRVLVAGYAGTGKTFMAVHRAITLVDTSRAFGKAVRVLICCFNKNLAEHILEEMLPRDAGIDVSHFHGLCDQIGNRVGLPSVRRRDETYFETGCVDRLLAAAETGAVETYDAVIIDEGQDFRRDWVEALEATLLRRDGTLLILYDPLQDIYRVGSGLSTRYGAPYYITINCRNTKQICGFMKRTQPALLSELASSDYAVDGHPPEVIAYRSDEEQRSNIKRIINWLLNDHSLRPRQIRLLSPFKVENTCLANVIEIAGCRLIPFHQRAGHDSERVLFTETVMSFKGLEGDAVIIHDVRGTWGTDAIQLYVASSRARFGLFILHDAACTLPL